MNRRTFIQKSTGASLATLALAGCTSNSTSGVQASERIKTARETLLENEETFENFGNQFESGETPNFDAEQVKIRVERANNMLDEAEQYASDEQMEQINALRAWSAFQSKRAVAIELSIELTSKWDTVSAYLDSAQYRQAKTALDEAESIYSDLKTATDEMVSAYEDVNRDVLEEGGLAAYHNQITNWFSNTRNWLEMMGIFFDGMSPMLDGFIQYMDGAEAYQDERFSQAAQHFGEAETSFAIAERELEHLQEYSTELPTFEAESVRLICAADALGESAGYMEDSSRAAAQGDYESAREYANKAREAANKCGFSSS